MFSSAEAHHLFRDVSDTVDCGQRGLTDFLSTTMHVCAEGSVSHDTVSHDTVANRPCPCPFDLKRDHQQC